MAWTEDNKTEPQGDGDACPATGNVEERRAHGRVRGAAVPAREPLSRRE